jgi:hypothetical protein
MWKPQPDSVWACLPICGHQWNTFDTGGVCPKCDERFEQTQCLRCRQFSPHREWYHHADPALTREQSKSIEE